MLREIKDGAFARCRRAPLGRCWTVACGAHDYGPLWSTRGVRSIEAAQASEPVALIRDGRRCTWVFEGRFYVESDGLAPGDVLALVRDRERRARRRLERAHASLAREDGGDGGDPAPPRSRTRIPADLRRVVFERDGGRCVECGSDFDIQYDHVIPHSLGGAATVENLQLLCAGCNQRKGASLR